MTYADLARRTPRLATTAEMARILAPTMRISERTVLAWALAGKIPSVLTPGGHRRYDPAEVLAAVEAQREDLGP